METPRDLTHKHQSGVCVESIEVEERHLEGVATVRQHNRLSGTEDVAACLHSIMNKKLTFQSV